jgi:hypothetical protein
MSKTTNPGLILLIHIFSICFFGFFCLDASKALGQSVLKMQTDTLTKKTDTNAVGNIPSSLSFECLLQDKPFFDSLIMHRCNYDAGGHDQTFAYIDTVPDIVRKLFPNVIFFNNYIWIDADSKPKLSAYYNGSFNSDAARLFNRLFKEVHNTQDYNLEDKITAFLYIMYGFSSNINKIESSSCSIDLPYIPLTFNLKVNTNINNVNQVLLFYIKNFQILGFIEFESNNIIKKHLFLDETP